MNASPAPDSVFYGDLWGRGGNKITAIPKRGTFFRERDANARNICCLRKRRARPSDFIRRARRAVRQLAATQPRREHSKLAIVELDDISTFRQIDNERRIDKRRAQIHIEKLSAAPSLREADPIVRRL